MQIKLVTKPPQGVFLWASGFFLEEENTLPSVTIQVLRRNLHDPVLETYVHEGDDTSCHLAIRLGPKSKSTRRKREESGAALYRKAREGQERVLVLDIRKMGLEGLDLLVGMVLSSWRFDKYRTVFKPEEKSSLEQIIVLCEDSKSIQEQFKRLQGVIEGVLLARSLTSEPPNMLPPCAYAEKLKELEKHGVKVEVLDEKALHAIGMKALLAVGKGSSNKPVVVVMTWNGCKELTSPIAIVGKGVCFDSGGLCLKSVKAQQHMKWDKAGAGVVSGLMKTLALQKASVHVVGIVGLVENMPDGNAAKPGDIVETMSGQTIEIVDTDAEGRLVLADCLWYAQQKLHPMAMIDLGTLTMETVASLGHAYAGLYANDSQLVDTLKSAGKFSGEEVWELPMGEFFAKQIDSFVADIKNSGVEGCGENGASAEFLKRFVKDIPWAHLDIAGVSWTLEQLPLAQIGVTGFGVRLLEEWIHVFKKTKK